MSTAVENFLAHYGVKGMKWGVRKGVEVVGRGSLSDPTLGTNTVAIRVTSSKANPANPEEANQTARATMETLHHMLTTKRGDIQKTMSKVDAKYDPMDLAQKPEVRRDYDHQMSMAMTTHAQKIAPKGAKAFVRMDGENVDLYVGSPEWFDKVYKGPIHHADLEVEGGVRSRLRAIRDVNGFVTAFEPLSSDFAHSTLLEQAVSVIEKEVKNGSG